MNKRMIKAAALTVSLAFGGLSLAGPAAAADFRQGSDHGHAPMQLADNGGPGDHHHGGNGHDRNGPPSPHRDWHQGEPVPSHYRSDHYQVQDWKAHNLSKPGHNQSWVEVNGDYVLMAVATGVILSIVTAH